MLWVVIQHHSLISVSNKQKLTLNSPGSHKLQPPPSPAAYYSSQGCLAPCPHKTLIEVNARKLYMFSPHTKLWGRHWQSGGHCLSRDPWNFSITILRYLFLQRSQNSTEIMEHRGLILLHIMTDNNLQYIVTADD